MPARRRRGVTSEQLLSLLREFKATAPTNELRAAFRAHSIGIGRKVTAGGTTDQLCLRVYVDRKRPMEELASEERVPETIEFVSRGLTQEVALPTDVIEAPPPVFEIDPTDRVRPAPGGVSVDAISGTAGTLGGWVWDTTDDTIVALSNDHVFGHTAGPDVIQPGPFDGGSSPADKIGDVKRGVLRSAASTNTVDAGIGDADSTDVFDLTVVDIGPAVYAVDVATLDMLVEKSGRTTGHTFGQVTDIDLETTVSGFPFDDCLRIDVVDPSPDWSAGGDSGSLVFSQTPIAEGSSIKPVVGLHFGGPQGGTYGIVCKIQNVFAQLDLTTLCAGAFAAFLESLFEVETGGDLDETEARLRTVAAMGARGPISFAPPPLVSRARRQRRGSRFHHGIALEVQQRLMTSKRGRLVTDLVDRHRAELLTLLAKDGDVRRATVAALRPILAGATTTTDVLERELTGEDLQRLDKLAREVVSKASVELRTALEPITALKDNAEGKSMARILGVRT
jgi:hypothetical protein